MRNPVLFFICTCLVLGWSHLTFVALLWYTGNWDSWTWTFLGTGIGLVLVATMVYMFLGPLHGRLLSYHGLPLDYLRTKNTHAGSHANNGIDDDPNHELPWTSGRAQKEEAKCDNMLSWDVGDQHFEFELLGIDGDPKHGGPIMKKHLHKPKWHIALAPDMGFVSEDKTLDADLKRMRAAYNKYQKQRAKSPLRPTPVAIDEASTLWDFNSTTIAEKYKELLEARTIIDEAKDELESLVITGAIDASVDEMHRQASIKPTTLQECLDALATDIHNLRPFYASGAGKARLDAVDAVVMWMQGPAAAKHPLRDYLEEENHEDEN